MFPLLGVMVGEATNKMSVSLVSSGTKGQLYLTRRESEEEERGETSEREGEREDEGVKSRKRESNRNWVYSTHVKSLCGKCTHAVPQLCPTL